jgi:glucose/arabinose dehydrogenase
VSMPSRSLKPHRLAGLFIPLMLLVAAMFVTHVHGQQNVEFKNGIPVAPAGLAKRSLPTKPVVYDTAEGMNIKVSVVTSKLEFPWSLAFLPDGTMLVTERAARLRVIRNGVLDPTPVSGTPKGYFAGTSGLPGAVHGYMDIVLHPKFADNHFVYLAYMKPLSDTRRTLAIARGKWDGKGLAETKDIYVCSEDVGSATRLAFGRDNTLFVSVSSGTPPETSQDPGKLAGKILRLNDDGSIPKDNPYVGKPNAKPEVYSIGHRNVLGMAIHPPTGQVWANENGPNGGDKINIILPGHNYGWPIISLGRAYTGAWQSQKFSQEGIDNPIVYWTPAIAISGMTFYTGDKLAKWKGDVFVGSLRTGEIPGTGHLERILFNDKMEELRRETLLTDLRQRIRDVRQGPDGLLYVITDEQQGAVLKIEPAQ